MRTSSPSPPGNPAMVKWISEEAHPCFLGSAGLSRAEEHNQLCWQGRGRGELGLSSTGQFMENQP